MKSDNTSKRDMSGSDALNCGDLNEAILNCGADEAVSDGGSAKTPEEVLNECGVLVTATVGTSMRPFLKSGRDSVVIEKKKGPYKKHDVLLYKRADGKFVLHRVYSVEVSENGELFYTMTGDAQTLLERGVTDGMILGLLTGVYGNGKYKSLESVSYNIYIRLMHSMVFRKLLFSFRSLYSKTRR